MVKGAGKLATMARRRTIRSVRAALVAFVLGALLGAGVTFAVVPHGGDTVPAEPDAFPPAVLAVEPPEGTVLRAGPVTFQVAFSEPLSAAPNVRFLGESDLALAGSFDGLTWRGSLTILGGEDGAYALEIGDVWDRAGNRMDGLSLAYEVDTVAPTSRAAISAANVTSTPFEISWDASDGTGSGVSRVEVWVRIDGGPWTLRTVGPEDRGVHRVEPPPSKARYEAYTVAVDQAGNLEDEPLDPDAGVLYDPSPPSAALLPAHAYWHRDPVDVAAIAAGDVSSAELRYYFAPDNVAWQGPFSAGNATSYEWTFGFPLGAGHYRLYAQARSPDGTTEADQRPEATELGLGFDEAPPTASLPPIVPYWQSTSLEVEVNPQDDRSGVASVELFTAYRPNGTASWSPWTMAASRAEPPWTFSLDFARGDGRYALAAVARDRVGWASSLPPPADAVGIGYNSMPPGAPTPAVARWIDPAFHLANVTWSASPAPDVVGFEVHRGADADFAPGGCPGTTCVATFGREARTAWAHLPEENVTHWFRIVAVDDGGLAAPGPAVAAVFHGRGFDTGDVWTQASSLPLGTAWSERLEYVDTCVDCSDVFRVELDRGEVLALGLAVPPSGDFRVVVLDTALRTVASSDTSGFGVWESLTLEAMSAGTYYVVVDWGFAMGSGRNEGWYTLTAAVA